MEIVLTLGNTDTMDQHKQLVENMILANSSFVRCCVSKASLEQHTNAINTVTEMYEKKTDKQLQIMMDVAIPKDKERIHISGYKMNISTGEAVIIQNNMNASNENIKTIAVEFPLMSYSVGDILRIGDNSCRLIVEKKLSEHALLCSSLDFSEITNGISIASIKGCIKHTDENIYTKNIALIRAIRPTRVALSYIENKDDVLEIQTQIEDVNYHPYIISKIETQKGIENLSEILTVSDEIMIARGCLAINIGLERLYDAQAYIAKICASQGIPCSIASNILKSMSGAWKSPSRADAIDMSIITHSGISSIIITNNISRSKECKNMLNYIEVALNTESYCLT